MLLRVVMAVAALYHGACLGATRAKSYILPRPLKYVIHARTRARTRARADRRTRMAVQVCEACTYKGSICPLGTDVATMGVEAGYWRVANTTLEVIRGFHRIWLLVLMV